MLAHVLYRRTGSHFAGTCASLHARRLPVRAETPPEATMTDIFAATLEGAGTHRPGAAAFAFDNSYARLPERFFARLAPTPVPAPRLIRINVPLARHLSIDPDRLAGPDGVEMLAGNRLPEGAEPIAMAYA